MLKGRVLFAGPLVDYALNSPFGVAMQSALITGSSPTNQAAASNPLRDDSPGKLYHIPPDRFSLIPQIPEQASS